MDENQKINWIIETGYDEDVSGIINKVKQYGDSVLHGETLCYKEKEVTDFLQLNAGNPVMTLASIRTCNFVRRIYGAEPGVFCSMENFRCTAYYPKLYKYLLNKNYILLPFENISNHIPWLNKVYDWKQPDLFIRPNSGGKQFNGSVIPFYMFEPFIKSLNEAAMQGELVLIAQAAEKLGAEYRVFCHKDKVVCGSSYRVNGEIHKSKRIPESVYSFARNIVDHLSKLDWYPDVMYSLDIGSYTNWYTLIEINSLSASGFYDCDLDILIPEIRRATLCW
jgi:hypothetical protein